MLNSLPLWFARMSCFSVALTLLAVTSIRQAQAVPYTWNVASGSWDTAGNWTPGGGPPTTGDTGAISSGTATAGVALVGTPDITVDTTGTLLFNSIAGPATGGTITAGSGGLLQWQGTSTGATTISLLDGSTIGRSGNQNAPSTSADSFTIAAGATATVGQINTTVPRSTLGMFLTGSLASGDASSTLRVNPGGTGSAFIGPLSIAPTSANSYAGDILLESFGSNPGRLVLSGTGALANVDAITFSSGGQLRFTTATDPLPSAYAMNVASGGRVEWERTQTYTGTVPTITFQDGTEIGREEDLNALGVAQANIVIAPNATLTASRIFSSVSRSTLGMRLDGSLSGDGTTTLAVNPNAAGNNKGSLVLNPSTANSGFTGDVELTGFGSNKGTLVMSGTGALSNVGAITINGGGQLRFTSATDPLPSAYAMTVPTGGRVEWERAQTYSVTVPTITFQDGTEIGREEDVNVLGIAQANIVIAPNATLTASRINASVSRSTLGLRLDGSLSGDGTTTLAVNPNAAGNNKGSLVLNPSTANTGFTGDVELTGFGANYGTLVLDGTGALSNVGTININSGGMLRFRTATDPLPSAYALSVPSGGRVEWEGTQNYTVTEPTITFLDGSEFGREDELNVASFSDDNIVIDSGATVTATRINASVVRSDLGMTLRGPLSGDATTTLVLSADPGTNQLGPLTLNPSSANPFAGTFEVSGNTVAKQAGLILNGTGPLANAKLLDIQEFGTVQVDQAGAADDIGEIRVRDGGTLQFRDASGSTLDGTTLTGNGLVRSETTNTSLLLPQAVRSLTFTNTTVAPGLSAGELTIEASLTTFDMNSILQMEVGQLNNDLLTVEGDLQLLIDSALELQALPDLVTGTYVIATYSGTLTGEFGTVLNNLGKGFKLDLIDYGTLTNSQISISILEVPEPSSVMLLGLGMMGMTMSRRRRKFMQKP